MEKPKKYFKNTFHHAYNRGVDKQNIFFEEGDYLYFLRRIKTYKEKYKIDLLCYCLMPNHFHLFLRQTTYEHTIGKFIGDLLNSYTKFINKKYKRSGVLFQGPTKTKIIENEDYFIWLFRYILENPRRAKIATYIQEWKFSSARDYLGLRKGKLNDMDEINGRFSSLEEMERFLNNDNNKFDYEYFEVWQ